MKTEINIFHSKSVFVLDLDGVVYAGSQAIPGAVEAIDEFKRMGKKVAFLTNNSMGPPTSVFEKLRKMGVKCTPEEVINSAQAAALYIHDIEPKHPGGTLVIGTPELARSLESEKVSVCADPLICGSVLVGMNFDFKYQDIVTGFKALQRGVPFIACNRDANFPSSGGELLPGAGALVGALEACSFRQPDVIIGKPSPRMLEILCKRIGVRLEDCVMFGDTLDSDITMANLAGIPSVFIENEASHNRKTLTSNVKYDLKVSSLMESLKHLR